MGTRACTGSARLPPPLSFQKSEYSCTRNEITTEANFKRASLDNHRDGHLQT